MSCSIMFRAESETSLFLKSSLVIASLDRPPGPCDESIPERPGDFYSDAIRIPCAIFRPLLLNVCNLNILRESDNKEYSYHHAVRDKMQTCRPAHLQPWRFADLPTCILLDFREFEKVTEFTANSVLVLLIS